MTINYSNLREFIGLCRDAGEVRDVRGASWDLEIGALIEAVAEKEGPSCPLLVFDDVPGYPAGSRCAGLTLGSKSRSALALGLNPERTSLELVRDGSALMVQATARPIAPRQVEGGAIFENAFQRPDIDVLSLPVPRYKEGDGGRFIGTGGFVINRDPDTGYVNLGTYRVQVHDGALLGLWMSPGQQGAEIAAKYWRQGKACPVAMVFGIDPVSFMVAHSKLPWGLGELDVIGALRGAPVDVISGPLTGLPIPCDAEVAIEGEIPPPDIESRHEGPFGEWTGYYSGGSDGTGENQPVVRVSALYHRNDPILSAQPPTWFGAPTRALPFEAGTLWSQLEAAGIPNITGVFQFTPYLMAVSIKQTYAGHAQQVGHGVIACSAGARNGRYVVVVDDDIDVTSSDEVFWAMQTRSDPATDLDVVTGTWGSPLDPTTPPADRAAKSFTNSRGIVYATRPYAWKDAFPAVSRVPAALKDSVYRRFAPGPAHE